MSSSKHINPTRLQRELFKRTEGYASNVRTIYLSYMQQIIDLVKDVELIDGVPFSFTEYGYSEKVTPLLRKMYSSVYQEIRGDVEKEWLMSNMHNDELVKGVFGESSIRDYHFARYFKRNKEAMDAFFARKTKTEGLSLSQRVWKYTGQFREELEKCLDLAIGEGTGANRLATKIKEYLQEPDKFYRRFRVKIGEDENGNPVYGRKWKRRVFDRETDSHKWVDDNPKNYHPGQGVYRSSYRNAQRLSRTETNMAYRTADFERWQELDFVVGIEIKLSNNHPVYDVCDELAGVYPKNFKWTGWHPNCYSDDSYVLTNSGWKLFKDVYIDDLIFSLNPGTRLPEWVGIDIKQKYEFDGKMIHFSNRSLDCLVTPDHEMVYLSKSNGTIKRRLAKEYKCTHGGFYRGCDWIGSSDEVIHIGEHTFNLGDFAEFMGYWLSDGSLIRGSQIKIAQKKGDPNRENIIKCVEKLGFKAGGTNGSIDIYSFDLNMYLKDFGICDTKYVPDIIKNADKSVIKRFLDAFISCDGHTRKAKPFIGNKGSECVPNNDERIYFTVSEQLASDIGELILKIGKRPSFRVNKTKGKTHTFRNGTYTINHDMIIISECNSVTATVFNKQEVDYKGYVYDLTLERNHIMYIRRNGKCFWGSNCRCYQIPVLATSDEIDDMLDRILAEDSENLMMESSQEVKDFPSEFKAWLLENQERMEKAEAKGTLPYFIMDNRKAIKEILGR